MEPSISKDSCGSDCGCNSDLSRREFMLAAGLTAAQLVVSAARPAVAVAGPFAVDDAADFPIPAEKRFDAAWLRGLVERGGPTVYRAAANELDKIGMPVGGICAGQLYLGGDGRLWHWDLFNLPPTDAWRSTAGPLYANPARPTSPIEHGFAIRVNDADGRDIARRTLDACGFREIEFRGEYPIGRVTYREPGLPVAVELEAFSPFIPLDPDDSGLPATILRYTVKNESAGRIDVELAGWVQNPVCLRSGREGAGERVNTIERAGGWTRLMCSAAAALPKEATSKRADIVFEDWEDGTYDGWTVTGKAFGERPRNLKDIVGYQGNVNAQGAWTVNTHETRGGEDVRKADTYIGTLTSGEFTIERDYVSMRLGGGNHPGQTCINLLIDGAPVRTATGQDRNRMAFVNWDVREYAGRTARLQVVDGWTGGWGQIGVDDIVFTDSPREEIAGLENQPDFGTLVLAVKDNEANGWAELPERPTAVSVFGEPGAAEARRALPRALVGGVGGRAGIEPGQSHTFTFILAWHFDGLYWDSLEFLTDGRKLRRHYGTRFGGASEVAAYVAGNLERLTAQTRLWRDTWYDATLPWWLLERTFANSSTLATATCYRFNNGRFYGWEGTYCCPGTCTHVWQYAQAVARLFPQLERSTREMVDFGLAFREESGQIDYRAEAARELAVDGQAGTILRAYREHQMSADDAFLRRIWPRVKKATELLIARDAEADGILDGAQYNTLDTAWFGQIAWISSLYLAAVKAAGAMAAEMGDAEFAGRCGQIATAGSQNLVARLFNGEYFVQKVDPAHPEANSTGEGCHIDQLLGQAWAHQVGLGRVVPPEPSQAALRALYKYSFTPDVGPYRRRFDAVNKGGRWYAMPGEGGLLMCTWPRGGIEAAAGKSGDAWAAGYFNECMSGFEWQVAAHMIWEGLVEEGLAVARMIHDRYHAARRNPYNEVECSNHYARAMASYGVFLAVCGFEYHGPRGYLAFAPRVRPEDFRAAFTGAEGWGSISQRRSGTAQVQEIAVKWGRVTLREMAFELAPGAVATAVSVSVRREGMAAGTLRAALEVRGRRAVVTLAAPVVVLAGETLVVTLM